MLTLIIFGVLSRLLPHPANMTAVGGIALFSGAKLEVKKAIIVTLVTMIISDVFIGFHILMWATYGSLVLAVLVGRWVNQRVTVGRIAGGVLLSSLLFFVITNFAVWGMTPLYPKTINGLITCYIMALPFFRNSLVGDFGYTFIVFGSFEFVLYIVGRIHMAFASKKYNGTDELYA